MKSPEDPVILKSCLLKAQRAAQRLQMICSGLCTISLVDL
jgi:hypothetical protein